ncbi:MAG: hypothetical protein ACOVO1_13765 [Chitinophagaceae bacterium]
MNYKEYQQYIPKDFNDNSRVWIYQCNRMLGLGEALQIEPLLENFVANWKSHGAPVKGYANLLFGQFIIIMADEEQSAIVGGCSTDSSVRIIKQIEQDLKVEMFNRQTLALIVKDKIEMLPLAQINYAISNGFVNTDTLFFNNLVATKKELLEKWIIPIKDSWLATRLVVNG